MSLSELDIGNWLIVVRAIHFAATAILAGALIFRVAVAGPALRQAPEAAPVLASHVKLVAWISFVVAVVTGLLWLQLETMSITGMSVWETWTSEGIATVVEVTQFGQVTAARQLIAIALAIGLVGERIPLLRRLALVAALAFVAAIAWTGHAGSTAGNLGLVHLASDVLHLWAASAWVGGLIMLGLLLTASRRRAAPSWRALAIDVVGRFSTLGIVSVATLVVSGAVNAWIIVGSWEVLFATVYGELLLLKIVVFAAMLTFACINRLWLTPQLASRDAQKRDASLALARNTLIELGLGLIVFAIVGALGLQHPMIHP